MGKIIIHNPSMEIEPGRIRDPFIMNYCGVYYMVATLPPFWEREGDCPGVKMWHSRDLVHWMPVGLLIKREELPEDAGCRDRFWAPELFVREDRFYLMFSASNEKYEKPLRLWLARADKITGPYTLDSFYEPANYGIDGNLFQDDDGQVYLTFAWGGIHLCKFDLEKGRPCSEIRKIVDQSEKEGEWDSHPFVEGNFLTKKNGRYWLWYSCPGRSYEMGLAVTDRLSEPFVKWPGNPVLSGWNTAIHFAGHNSCFSLNDGREAIAFHGHGPDEPERLCIEIVDYPMESRAPGAEVEIWEEEYGN